MNNRRTFTLCILAMLVSASRVLAHDAWLAPRWNTDKTQVLISALVAEHFPNGEPIKGLQRFVEPRAHLLGTRSIALTGDPSDSTLLGSLSPAPSIIVATGVKQREIKIKRDLAERYLVEEVGHTREEAAQLLRRGRDEFQHTYSRYLKTVVTMNRSTFSPRDSAVGLPLELVLLRWEQTGTTQASIQFRLLKDAKALTNSPVRVLTGGKTIIVRTDSEGKAEVSVETTQPALLTHIHVSSIDDNMLNSIWTNLALYKLEE